MTLHGAMRIGVLACCLLGFGAFGVAESAWGGMAVLLIGGAAGWWVTDGRAMRAGEERRPWRGLPRWVSNVMLGVIILVAVLGAWKTRSLVSTFAILLASVMLLKLWQERRPRDYGQLLTMSLFLTIGATLSDITLPTGLLVLLQTPVMLATAMLYHIWSSQRAAQAANASVPLHNALTQRLEWKRMRAPLALVCVLACITGGVIAAGIFLTMPRGVMFYQIGPLRPPNIGRVGGYVEEVDLNQSGLISESRVQVMEVAVSSVHPAQPWGSADMPIYLRGAILDQYKNGRWVTSPPQPGDIERATRDSGVPIEHPRPERASRLIRVTPRLQRIGSMHPAFSIDRPWRWEFQSGASIVLDRRFSTLSYQPLGPFAEYDIYSTTAPNETEVSRRGQTSFPDPRVGEIAAQVLRRASIEPDPSLRPEEQDALATRALEAHLRGLREYTLNPPVPPIGADPTVWFLTSASAGHCEFFASALAAMCRSVGIDARVAAGYLATEFDPEGGVRRTGAYVVRASDAHAWVEVNTSPGVWRVFDATPAMDGAFRRNQRTFVGGVLDRLFSGAQNAWNTSIISFDRSVQQRLFGGAGTQPPRWVARVTSLLNPRQRTDALRASGHALMQWWPAGVGTIVVAGVLLAWRWRVRRRGAVSGLLPGHALDSAPPAARALHAELLRTLQRLKVHRDRGATLNMVIDAAPIDSTGRQRLAQAVALLYQACFAGRADVSAMSESRRELRRMRPGKGASRTHHPGRI